jgi:hypothetical protein
MHARTYAGLQLGLGGGVGDRDGHDDRERKELLAEGRFDFDVDLQPRAPQLVDQRRHLRSARTCHPRSSVQISGHPRLCPCCRLHCNTATLAAPSACSPCCIAQSTMLQK